MTRIIPAKLFFFSPEIMHPKKKRRLIHSPRLYPSKFISDRKHRVVFGHRLSSIIRHSWWGDA